jgi:steroid 5-alpha reductase family enzyme
MATHAASAWGFAAIVMAALWIAQLLTRRGAVAEAAWPPVVACLAVFHASVGAGAWPRRLAIAWMIGSWGARLGVYLLWDRVVHPAEDARSEANRSFWHFQLRAVSAVLFSLPALFASANPEPVLTRLELGAAALWMVGFAGESTADRQLLRFKRDAAHRGRTCDTGLWRASRHPNYFFDWLMWVACALFAAASPLGWIAIVCPIVMLHLLVNVTGIPRSETQALRSRGDGYREYQLTTSAFLPWFRKKATASSGTRRAQLRELCSWILNLSAGRTRLPGGNRSLNGRSSGS